MEKDKKKIMRDFSLRKTLQTIAIAAALVIMMLLAAIYKRPDLFGEFAKSTLASMQILLMLIFLNFTALNWRCPSCKKYLGNDLVTHKCKHCGVRLK